MRSNPPGFKPPHASMWGQGAGPQPTDIPMPDYGMVPPQLNLQQQQIYSQTLEYLQTNWPERKSADDMALFRHMAIQEAHKAGKADPRIGPVYPPVNRRTPADLGPTIPQELLDVIRQRDSSTRPQPAQNPQLLAQLLMGGPPGGGR